MSVFIGIKLEKKYIVFLSLIIVFLALMCFLKLGCGFFFFVIIFSEGNFWIILRKEE